MKRTEQSAPFQIELEFVYGCNLGCKFCGLQGVKAGFTRHRFMEEDTLKEICTKIAASGWRSKILVSGHGEPMLHPKAIEFIKIIKQCLPNNHLYFVTNGTGITEQTLTELFNSGVDSLTVDEYTGIVHAERIRKYIMAIPNLIVNDWKTSEQKHVRERTVGKVGKKCLSILEPIEESLDKTRKLVNRCGSAFPKNDSRKNSKCSKPFREMFFDYQGNLLLCCNDFRREYIGPNIFDYDTIQKVWNHPSLEMYRKLLYKGCRCIFPCDGCDALSYRVGLLPDPLGKQQMPEWNEQDEAILKSISKNREDTRLRDWEVENEHCN